MLLPGHHRVITDTTPPILLCKAKRQYLLTCKVRRYCILALHGSILPLITGDSVKLLLKGHAQAQIIKKCDFILAS